MRLRNIKGADEEVAKNPYCVSSPIEWKGCWHTLFAQINPIHMEIGMGKGQFLLTLAKKNPHINYIGVERYTSVLLRALQKLDQEKEPVKNIRFLCIDAGSLPDLFEKGEITRIYLNFSDPWPKERHAQRRLISTEFMKRYDQVLTADGIVEFKTDNTDLFDFSLVSIPESGWKIDAFTRDLHHDPTMNWDNVMTEYEEKFSSKGNPIYKLIASRN
ncbi:MAG: tRNA (guanosine(46)-N7)-methyltransferase TrmB [Lachnospiraceae bacterium]